MLGEGSVCLAKGIMERENGLISAMHRGARWLGAVLFLAAGLLSQAQSALGPAAVVPAGCDMPLVSDAQAVDSLPASGPATFQFAFALSTEPTTWTVLVTAMVFFFAFQWRSK